MKGRRLLRGGLLASLVLGQLACDPSYDGISVKRVAGHVDAEASSQGLSVPEGGLLVFKPEVHAEGGDYDVLDELEFSVFDASVAPVVRGLRVDTWMLLGSQPGSTEVEVIINGEVQDSIPVTVHAQEASS